MMTRLRTSYRRLAARFIARPIQLPNLPIRVGLRWIQVIEFGYVTLFASAFPLAAALSVVSAWVADMDHVNVFVCACMCVQGRYGCQSCGRFGSVH